MPTAAQNARVRKALEKCVAKIESNQQKDGSWNVGGGWAPILGTSMASRSLYEAQQKGVNVDAATMAQAENYTKAGRRKLRRAGDSCASAAGVPLYQSAQALEQLSRTAKDRRENAPQIAAIKAQLTDEKFVNGFGSIGGEEFFSYLNVSDGLRRTGGEEWNKWHARYHGRILKLQNQDGTWAGSHCITGRVAMTSAAILNLTVRVKCSGGRSCSRRSGPRPAGVATSALGRAVRWLWSQQSEDGGWHSQTYGLLRSGQSLTPFVLDALLAVPARSRRESIGRSSF